MRRISTPESLPSLLYENPELKDVILDPALQDEWEALRSIQHALDEEVLVSPSDTSIEIIMAYALGKEETAASPR